MTRLKTAGWWMGSLLICTWAVSAQAQTCDEAGGCPTGYTCEQYEAERPCAAPDCQDPEMCPAPPDGCGTEVYYACTPAACETDADCGENMVCYEQTLTSCSGAAEPAIDCPPNEPCPAMAESTSTEPSCTQETVRECTPRYALPCEQDIDCGVGFTCEVVEECSCSAGKATTEPQPAPVDGGASDTGGGADPAPPTQASDAGTDAPSHADSGASETCECHPSELKHCELEPMACDTDNDCPSDFVCESVASDSVASCDPQGDAATCDVSATQQPDAEKFCVPPFIRGDVGGSAESGAAQTTTDASAPKAQDGADAGTATDTDDTANEAQSNSDTGSTGGCSVGATGDRASASWLSLVLLSLGLRARRRQPR